jgi:hypothetical protein
MEARYRVMMADAIFSATPPAASGQAVCATQKYAFGCICRGQPDF